MADPSFTTILISALVGSLVTITGSWAISMVRMFHDHHTAVDRMKYDWRLKRCDQIVGSVFDVFSSVHTSQLLAREDQIEMQAASVRLVEQVIRLSFTSSIYFSKAESAELLRVAIELEKSVRRIQADDNTDANRLDELYKSYGEQHQNMLKAARQVVDAVPKTKVTWPAVTQMLE